MIDFELPISMSTTNEKKIRQDILRKWRHVVAYAHCSFDSQHQLKGLMDALEEHCGVVVLMEDGNRWEGFLCGKKGRAEFRLAYKGNLVENALLIYEWFDESVHGVRGKIEVNAYVS